MALKMPFFIKMSYKITPLGTAQFCTYNTVLTLVLPSKKQNQGVVETECPPDFVLRKSS